MKPRWVSETGNTRSQLSKDAAMTQLRKVLYAGDTVRTEMVAYRCVKNLLVLDERRI